MSYRAPEKIAAEHLKSIIAEVLGYSSPESISDDETLEDLGADYVNMSEIIFNAEGDMGWAIDDDHDIWTESERLRFPAFLDELNRAAGAISP